MNREKGPTHASHSGRSPLERHVLRAQQERPQQAPRPRIVLPDFPRPLALEEDAPEDDILLPDEDDWGEEERTDPKLIPGSKAVQVKIPR